MAKPEQILAIEPPNELTFYGPFTSAVSSTMRLINPSDSKVCFKIRTTAPKRYCVKPNSGVIDPKESVQISVSLQPFEYDPNEKNRHKFMVQSMIAPDGEINQDTLWKSDPGQMMDSKLKCVFVMPPSAQNLGLGGSGGENNGDDASVRSEYQSASQMRSNIPPSPKNVSANDNHMLRSIEEVKKLQEEVSTLRQENIQLREEALRQKRIAANRSSDSDSLSSGGAAGAAGSGFSSISVAAANPNANALSASTLYAAVIVLILGVILGKWVF